MIVSTFFVLFVAGGALGGLLMGLILQRTELDFSGASVLLLVIGWALAGLLAILAMNTNLAGSVAGSTGLTSLFGDAFAIAAVAGAVYGIVGGLATLFLIGRAQQ